MPEQLTRHPEVTLQVLKSAGAQCGSFAPQDILKTCPAERFCKLPGGEVCIYGIADAPRMTQFTAADWHAVALATRVLAPASPGSAASVSGAGALHPMVATSSGVALVLLGVAIGWMLRRRPP
ncbi:MAG TPA: hypothetical protein VF169_09480 [Albitalea sp.]|uniref:hypothetical protein n=1 Tax=Piscinibacter sp. TaxID=1903157 RepID=UPI002ED37B69